MNQLRLEDVDAHKVVVQISSARKFLGEELSLASMASHFPPEESLFEVLEPPG